MLIHTSATYGEVCSAAESAGVLFYVTSKGSRKRDRAFEVTLYVLAKDALHRRYGNSGSYGSKDDVAATWDEWGNWMVALYDIDPDAIIGHYETEADFYDQTRRHRDYVRMAHKEGSIPRRTQTAPWLD